MRRDRRAAVLIGLWAGCALAVAVAAVVAPARADAVAPAPLDLLVGWTLLVAGVACFRSPTGATLLTAAGVTWVAVGLAPLADGAWGGALPRLALFPTALLLLAAALLPRERLAGPAAWAQAAALVGTAALGGAGVTTWAMAAMGVAVLVPPIARVGVRPGVRARDRSATIQIGAGAGILLVGVLVATGAGAPELAVDLHASLMIGLTIAVAWQLAPVPVAHTEGLELGEPLGIGRALGELVGTGPIEVVFPTPDGGWVDPAGNGLDFEPSGAAVRDQDGSLLAVVSHAWRSIDDPDPAVRRFLAAASRGGELRATLRSQAVDIERSRGRLEKATDSERQRLAARIDAGPVQRLETVRGLLQRGGCGPSGPKAPLERLDAAQALLQNLVLGLDPAPEGEDLGPALARLVETHGGVLRARWAENAEIGRDVRRVVWFTCAEALTNVAKHAPGCRADVDLEVDGVLRLTIRDAGPGGADVTGSGLSGLVDRARSVGGHLAVTEARPGTVVELVVPLGPAPRGEGFPASGDVFSPIRSAAVAPRLAT